MRATRHYRVLTRPLSPQHPPRPPSRDIILQSSRFVCYCHSLSGSPTTTSVRSSANFASLFHIPLLLLSGGGDHLHPAAVPQQDRPPGPEAGRLGAFAGMFGAIGIGIAFIIAFYATNEQFFQGRTEYIVEAILVSLMVSRPSHRLALHCRALLRGGRGTLVLKKLQRKVDR